MWRLSSSADRRLAGGIVLAGACIIAACGVAEEIAMRQPIEMGPWKFEVSRADDRTESRGGQQLKIVTVELKLHNYEQRHSKPFDEFLNGRTPGAMMSFPHLRLEDARSTSFDGLLIPVSGGSLRSQEWRAEFVLVPSSATDPMADPAGQAAKYLDTRVSDLKLILDNPDRQAGQPGRVLVPLK